MGVKQESADSALYVKGKGGGSKRRGDVDDSDEDFDLGNTKNCEGVCFRCGYPQHIAQFCVVNMPNDIKCCILNHSAHIATIDQDDHNNNDLFVFAVDHGPNRPTSLTTTFSDLALTKFTLDSTNVNTVTTTTAQSVADSMIATPRKKGKIGAKSWNHWSSLFNLMLNTWVTHSSLQIYLWEYGNLQVRVTCERKSTWIQMLEMGDVSTCHGYL